ncbi:hypothetical protein [Chryseobacterium sp.]|uniref:hypothetical protein n=1 Tax=Chryseobacterium sp. TaxID=1871047 RepID=UPI002FCB3364
MKTKIIFCLIVLTCIKMFSQENDSIVYDFSKGVFEKNNISPQFGKSVVFKIKNINRIFYSPNVKGLIGEVVDETIGLNAPKTTKNSENPVPNSENIESEIIDKESKYNFKLNAISPQDEIKFGENIMLNKKFEYIPESTKSEKNLYKEYKKKLSALSIRLQTYVYIINKLNGSYTNYLEKINTPDLTYSVYKKIYDDSNIPNNIPNNSFETSVILNAAGHTDKYVILNKYFLCKTEFKDFLSSTELQDIISEFDNVQNKFASDNIRKEIDDWRNYISKTDEDISKMNLHQKLNYVEIVNRILLNKNSYEYISEPIQAYGDYLSFDIDIKEKKKVENDYIIFNSSRKFSYKEFVTGGMRLDFGVGVSLDFGHRDQKYSINDDTFGNKYLLESTKNDYTPKLVGLLHASRRSCNSVAFGFSLGTALDVANFDISSIYLGPSLLWGRADKIIFTAGPSFRKINQLNPQFEKYIKQEALPSNFDLDESKYVDNYKIGFFFSITYNLTNTQRGKFLQVQKGQ